MFNLVRLSHVHVSVIVPVIFVIVLILSHGPFCQPKALCALSPIQLLFGWLVGPVRLKDVWKCTSMESGEQFVVGVGTHWTAK